MPTATLNAETQKQNVFFDTQINWTETTPQEVTELAQEESQKALGALTIPEFAPEQSQTDELKREEYGCSLRRMRELGRAALRGEVTDSTKEASRRDWFTSLAEMLKNAEKFKGKFEITDEYTYPVMDSEVMFLTPEGPKSMEGMIRDGERKAWQAAETEPLMATEARRAGGDAHNMVCVNGMVNAANGPNTRLAISRSIGEEFGKNREFWEDRGYCEDLPFIQVFYADRTRGKVSAGTLSMGGVRDATIDKVLAEYGQYMQPGDNDNGMRHGVEKTFGSKEEAMAWAKAVRARCYELQGDTGPRMSVNEFMAARKQYLHAAFDSLCVPMAQAIESKEKNGQVQQFVSGLLSDTRNLDAGLVAKLQKLAGKHEIDDSDGRLLLGLSLHATAEKLYKDAEALFINSLPNTNIDVLRLPPQQEYFALVPQHQMIQQLTGHVHSGARAGRSHSGPCPGKVSVAGSNDANPDNPQSAFGGLGANGQGSEERAESGSEGQSSGKKKMNCPFCKESVYDDPCARKLECPHCKAKVVDGKVVNKGDGGSQARTAKKMDVNGIGFWITGGKSKDAESKKRPEARGKKGDYTQAA